MSAFSRRYEQIPITTTPYKRQIVWTNVLFMVSYHVGALYGLYQLMSLQAQWKTIVWAWTILFLSSEGVTLGAHRLWSHSSYKSNVPFRVLLIICQAMAFQSDGFEWARDHRLHHKYNDTDADPYNNGRGFFFAHMGWLMVRKHPAVLEKGKFLDVSDLKADKVLMFQRRYFTIMAPVLALLIPTIVPVWFWDEDMLVSWFFAGMFRYVISLHFTWSVNSFSHWLGMKPYDKNFSATENNIVSHLTFGDSFHNFHHTFPWDYRTAEVDKYSASLSAYILEFMAKIGWIYDLRTASDELIKKRMLRTGDDSK